MATSNNHIIEQYRAKLFAFALYSLLFLESLALGFFKDLSFARMCYLSFASTLS